MTKNFDSTDLVLVVDLDAGNKSVPSVMSISTDEEEFPLYEIKAMEREDAEKLENGGIVEIVGNLEVE